MYAKLPQMGLLAMDKGTPRCGSVSVSHTRKCVGDFLDREAKREPRYMFDVFQVLQLACATRWGVCEIGAGPRLLFTNAEKYQARVKSNFAGTFYTPRN